jgi:hypothetical protein
MSKRLVLIALVLLAAGCTRGDGRHAVAAPDPVVGTGMDAALAGIASFKSRPSGRGFANLADHGDLLAYPGKVVRQDGAYTLYRADLSEEHALRAIASGRLRVVTPKGEILDFQYDRHIEHPSGDWTWIGHRPSHEGEQAILTFGAEAAFGSIAQGSKPPLRLTVRDGASWLVETDPAKVARIVNAATRPQRPDYHIVPESELPHPTTRIVAAADGATTSPRSSAATPVAATAAAATTVDLLIGYTTGFANANGGTSGATTRLNYLVDVANAAYGNSKVDAQVRLVKAMQVTYTDTNSNDTALEQLSGYKSGSGPVTPNPAFNALRAAREQYGADLVSLVRDFRDPEQGGCGIAWLLGGGLQGIGPGEGWDELGYSVAGDGADVGSDGKGYYCQDETLAHELGHNMGAAHDRETAKGDNGVLDNPDDYGAYTYSFGYKTGATTGNFYTVMAYGDSGQRIYRVFSNPAITFCGGRACGRANQEDNALALRQTMPEVAAFRAGMGTAVAPTLLRELDTDGQGTSDLLLFNHDQGKVTTWFMSGIERVAYSSISVSGSLRLVDMGDFDGNGTSDLLFDNPATRRLYVALSSGSNYTVHLLSYAYSSGQVPMAVADINGNGKADILLRNTATGNVATWFMSGLVRDAYNAHGVATAYSFVGHGSLDGDARQDLLWTDATGRLLLETSTGTTFSAQVLPYAYNSATYVAAGVLDVNGNGKDDIVLASKDGAKLAMWYMDGAVRTSYNSQAVDPAYELVGKGDFDGNHRDDLVAINPDTRQLRMLLSSGVAFATSTLAVVPGAGSRVMDVQ